MLCLKKYFCCFLLALSFNHYVKANVVEAEGECARNVKRLEDEVQQLRQELTARTADVIGHVDEWDANFNCTRKCGPRRNLAESCNEAVSHYRNGAYLLHIPGSKYRPFYAYCEVIDNKIWMIIQRREDGSVDFNRTWNDYKQGFGNLYGDFWVGLDRLHEITSRNVNQLRIWLEDENGTESQALYKNISIANESGKYELHLGRYSSDYGDAGDSLGNANHSGIKFSTFDNCNNDNDQIACTKAIEGGWWHHEDSKSFLNGRYDPEDGTDNLGIYWNGFGKNLRFTRMALRHPYNYEL